ncbi:unnamed protein product [Medioppia subpectinata]|uniref:Uncharacterized protein n=1 Tax=Medioppia subpectinata TaxID=1979941 RepID=A0A7R9Q2Y7_9ACAR|nr:unnamed protein product [Medioppia subpectinata]CAG2110706.1 unnamed protein product [Medioppia subpectinata]
MAANVNQTIDDMIGELNAIKESAIGSQPNDVNRIGGDLIDTSSQMSVQSIDGHKIVINFNLNKNNELNESSVCDNNDENQEPDGSGSGGDHRNESGSGSGGSAATAAPPGSHSNGANNLPKSNSDSAGDDSQHPSNQSLKSRLSRRTISESSSNEVTHRGILKYTHNWIRRTVSESSCDAFPNFDVFDIMSDIQSSCQSLDDMYSDDDIMGSAGDMAKTTKNVRFSDNISKTVFRPTSSILGRKSKNQKRAKNRKNSHRKDSQSSNESSTKLQKTDKLETERSRQDSGYDSEDNVGHGVGGDDPKAFAAINEYKNCIEIETEMGLKILATFRSKGRRKRPSLGREDEKDVLSGITQIAYKQPTEEILGTDELVTTGHNSSDHEIQSIADKEVIGMYKIDEGFKEFFGNTSKTNGTNKTISDESFAMIGTEVSDLLVQKRVRPQSRRKTTTNPIQSLSARTDVTVEDNNYRESDGQRDDGLRETEPKKEVLSDEMVNQMPNPEFIKEMANKLSAVRLIPKHPKWQ